MTYITHHRFHELAACGKQLNIPYGTKLTVNEGDFLCLEDGTPVCRRHCENAQKHFAINDDGLGLERGNITYTIAYADRRDKNGFRFSDENIARLTKLYSHFIVKDLDYIVFNSSFFEADIEELKKMADNLNIRIPKLK